jgi:RHH-type transcriptional regulator, proline utilization regulon repressor / proline dehydrogenase / delta 1-pyrroline-5-carboxylate dehydrogenase
MRIMGHQYVMGRNHQGGPGTLRKKDNRRFRYSFDMLGEAALTSSRCRPLPEAYEDAIRRHRQEQCDQTTFFAAPSISVKLSALHPRYEQAKADRVLDELVPVLLDLARLAREQGIALTVDAEEADRLMLSLRCLRSVLAIRPGRLGRPGLALQAYQKRLGGHRLAGRSARQSGHRIPIRLVKGAYWDTEIKFAQVEGLEVTRCSPARPTPTCPIWPAPQKVLARRQFYPQFATHNAHTIAAIAELAGTVGLRVSAPARHGQGTLRRRC